MFINQKMLFFSKFVKYLHVYKGNNHIYATMCANSSHRIHIIKRINEKWSIPRDIFVIIPNHIFTGYTPCYSLFVIRWNLRIRHYFC